MTESTTPREHHAEEGRFPHPDPHPVPDADPHVADADEGSAAAHVDMEGQLRDDEDGARRDWSTIREADW